MKRAYVIVAIDGYSSCGKSTLAKAIAKELNFVYVDSGAMYRAVTLYFIRNGIDLKNTVQISEALTQIQINFECKNQENHIFLNGENVSEEIRLMYISEKVSEISAIKEVRQCMVKLQQFLGNCTDIVMDGRDIGSVVFPNAQVKLFMTAQPEIRAKRRFEELKSKGNHQISLDDVMKNLEQRDYIDTTRTESPLVQTEDAIILDNSFLSQEEQLQFALERISEISTLN